MASALRGIRSGVTAVALGGVRQLSVAKVAVPALSRAAVASSVGASTLMGGRHFASAANDGYIILDESSQNVDQLVKDNDAALLYFTASWCGPCKMIAPHFANLAKENGSKVKFVKIDVDECGQTAEQASISAVPTFQVFKKGAKVEQFSGANIDKLKKAVTDLTA